MTVPRAILAALAVALTGCAAPEETERGGLVIGTTLTVYSVLPSDPSLAATAQDLMDGEKLALSQAGGRAGAYLVNYNTLRYERELDATAETVRRALRDPAVIAAIGDLDSESARVSVPLLNAAGVLHLSPGATYTGFVAPAPGVPDDEPERWVPSGQRSFAPLAPPDVVQARALARGARGRVAVEAEGGEASSALAAALRPLLGDRLVDDPARAATVVYAGDDADSALGVIEALGREAPRARVLLPEALLRTDLASRLTERMRGSVRFIASAGPADQAFADAFQEAFDRQPGPYAKVGFDGMNAVLAAIRRAGADANKRTTVIREYFAAKPLERLASAPWYVVKMDLFGLLEFSALD